MGDSLLMGLGEWLSLDIGLGERLLASLKAGKRGERLLQLLSQTTLWNYVSVWYEQFHWVYASTCPAAWLSLCLGRTLHLSACESDAHNHQEHPASSYKSPPGHVRIAD